MLKIIKLILSIVHSLGKAFERMMENKRFAKQLEMETKANAYDKLQKALQARKSVSDSPDKLMSNDGFKRD